MIKKRHNGLIFALTALVLAVSLSGCLAKPVDSGGDDGRLKVMATIFPAYDFARAVAGDSADVAMLIKPGASVHSYDPSTADIKAIADCDVFIYVGGESEEWVERILSSPDIKVEEKTVIRLIGFVETFEEEEALEKDEEHEHEDEHEDENEHEDGETDEHVWTSPKNAVTLVNAIAEGLSEADKENGDAYMKNAENYNGKIDALDQDIQAIVDGAKRGKIIVADKFPFLYLTRRYGLEYTAAFGGCSDQNDASAATIAALINTVKDENIPYIYYAELSTQNVANSVAGQTGAGTLLLHSCQSVTKDEFERGETYVSLMRQNAENLKKGLN